MAVLRYFAPALAAAGYAAAASCSVSATTTIQNGGDATALASCQTFSGSIAIATGASGNIALDGIQQITGSLIANNASQLQALSGDSLNTIGDTFQLQSLPILASLNFPLLSKASTVSFVTLPQLQGLMFQTGLQQVKSLTISDTNLAALTGINLAVANTVEINNNNYLKEINMHLGNVSQLLDISGNNAALTISLPNMVWANTVTIRNASAVSLPSLSAINDTLGFYGNSFQSLSVPNLTSIEQTLAIVQNNQLNNATFPELTTLGGSLQLQNNTLWDKINGFPSVQRVLGAVDCYGNFSELDLPAINYVRGDFNVQSYKDLTSVCNHFKPLKGAGQPIRGTYTCAGGLSSPNTTNTLPPDTSNGNDVGGSKTGSSTSSKSSTGLASPLLIPGATSLLGVVAAIFGLL